MQQRLPACSPLGDPNLWFQDTSSRERHPLYWLNNRCYHAGAFASAFSTPGNDLDISTITEEKGTG